MNYNEEKIINDELMERILKGGKITLEDLGLGDVEAYRKDILNRALIKKNNKIKRGFLNE